MAHCTACALEFADPEGTGRCPQCVKQSTVEGSQDRASMLAASSDGKTKRIPRLLWVGMGMWGGGMVALTTNRPTGHSISDRSELTTLGVLTFAGFVMTVIGFIRWRRKKA